MAEFKGSLAPAGELPAKEKSGDKEITAGTPEKRPVLKGSLAPASDLEPRREKPAYTPPVTEEVPVFTPPVTEEVPVFTPPVTEEAPVFTPPVTEETPVFTPPVTEEAPVFTPPVTEEIPVFTPPVTEDIPVFTPPADDIPIFTPPRPASFTGPACYHHKDFPAVDNCVRCGKPVCEDCREAYGVNSGEYAGRCLCYTCCKDLVQENVKLHKKIRAKLIALSIGTGIGMVFGFGCFIGMGILPALFGMLWFGSIWFWIKNTFVSYFKDKKEHPEGYDGGFGSLMNFLIMALVSAVAAPVHTTIKIISTIRNLIRANKIIQEDSAALEEINAYMEYTIICQRNAGASLSSLMAEGGELQNNIYAMHLRDGGEAAADESLRRCTTIIAENGEIIRSYAA